MPKKTLKKIPAKKTSSKGTQGKKTTVKAPKKASRKLVDVGGRPTVVTDEVLSKLEHAFALGASDQDACFYAGIAESTLYRYQTENEGFSERKEALKLEPVIAALETVVDGLKKDRRLAFDFLGKKRPKEWGVHRVDLTTDGNPIGFAKSDLEALLELATPEEKKTMYEIIANVGARAAKAAGGSA